MKDKKSGTIQELFHEAAVMPRDERTRFLTVACAGNDHMREELDRLLDADEAASGSDAWNRRALENEALVEDATGDPAIGETVGAYRMVELIGSGGMGNVYRAERVDSEYDKSVAVKRINARVDTVRVGARFRAERQILANLEHPNIARLLDGGVATDGTQYLIMEYVDGVGPLA
jgi:serine/threonine protein kinase